VPSAVVFAYHDVGVRCLAVLLARGVTVPLVVTHRDDSAENIWFGNVAGLAALHHIPVITPDDANDAATVEHVRACRPDFLFSFYYRNLLKAALLTIPARGAYNMHGSLLPKYRGRAPVNWAVLHGERETGASLHRMVEKPDAGDLVAQQRVSILPNDTAHEVMHKVTCAAESCLYDVLPALLDGSAQHTPLDLTAGNYFGRRRPDDGRINWTRSAWDIHNLIRAVAPPYPGAFFEYQGARIEVLLSHYCAEPAAQRDAAPRLYWQGDACYVDCSDGQRLQILQMGLNGAPLTAQAFEQHFGARALDLK
jgi:methionyl-tRNA formyltransferase